MILFLKYNLNRNQQIEKIPRERLKDLTNFVLTNALWIVPIEEEHNETERDDKEENPDPKTSILLHCIP